MARSKIPNGENLSAILPAIFEALAAVCHWDETGRKEHLDAEALKQYFITPLSKISPRFQGKDAHLSMGAYSSPGTRGKGQSEFRLGQLVISAFCTLTRSDNKIDASVLPSPLAIAFKALTHPQAPQTAAYAQFACTEYLFKTLRILPQRRLGDSKEIDHPFDLFTVDELTDSYSKIETEIKHRDNRGGKVFSKVDLLLLHYLAMKDILYFRFGTPIKRKQVGEQTVTTAAFKDKSRADRHQYCQVGAVVSPDGQTSVDNNFVMPEFRLVPGLLSLPDVQQIVNELFGIPLPIRGFETIFSGGLRPSASGGLVLNIEGAPGTGKTSLALSIAAAMAPFGTSCVYWTLEEAPDDLNLRASGLIPDTLKRLSYFSALAKRKWLFPVPVRKHRSLADFVEDGIGTLKEIVRRKTASRPSDAEAMPNPCPLMVVIDSLTPFRLFQHSSGDDGNRSTASLWREELQLLIEECRKLGALVILLSEDGEGHQSGVSYLVDTALRLEYRQCERLDQKPVRVLELLKTRHQISRPGSHVFHLSGKSGVRVSPQIPSLIDVRKHVELTVPTSRAVIDTLELWGSSPDNRHTQLRFKSHILINGVGSSGKAALGMRLLMTPLIVEAKQSISKANRLADFLGTFGSSAPRVLVISFLYPEAYYKTIEKRMRANIGRAYSLSELESGESALRVDYMSLSAGYLNPEDLVGKIERTLDAAIFEGRPYSGVLLDGLHNVYLQFPSLQHHHMIWPAIYTTLRRLGITTVTTFTSFDLSFASNSVEAEQLSFDKHLPVLHALVQSSDYMLTLQSMKNSAGEEEAGGTDREHELRVRSGMGRTDPTPLVWDARLMMIRGRAPTQPSLFSKAA